MAEVKTFDLFWDGGQSGEPNQAAFQSQGALHYTDLEDALDAAQLPQAPNSGRPWINGDGMIFTPNQIIAFNKVRLRKRVK